MIRIIYSYEEYERKELYIQYIRSEEFEEEKEENFYESMYFKENIKFKKELMNENEIKECSIKNP